MKRILLLFLFVTTALACSKDDSTEITDIDIDEFGLSAIIDGEPFILEIDQLWMGNYQNAGNAGGGNRISGCIEGTDECISISTLNETYDPNGFQVGTIVDFELIYTKGGQSYFNYNFNLYGSQTTNLANIPLGQFTITKRTESYVKGTFSFVGYNYDNDISINVTEGKFKIQIED